MSPGTMATQDVADSFSVDPSAVLLMQRLRLTVQDSTATEPQLFALREQALSLSEEQCQQAQAYVDEQISNRPWMRFVISEGKDLAANALMFLTGVFLVLHLAGFYSPAGWSEQFGRVQAGALPLVEIFLMLLSGLATVCLAATLVARWTGAFEYQGLSSMLSVTSTLSNAHAESLALAQQSGAAEWYLARLRSNGRAMRSFDLTMMRMLRDFQCRS